MKTCVAVITLTNCHGGIKVTGDVTSTILYNNKTLYNKTGLKLKREGGESDINYQELDERSIAKDFHEIAIYAILS